jgi:hypothetical protein
VTNRSLTRDEAVRRAALLDVASYDVALTISDDATFTSRTAVRFTSSEPGSSTFVELADAHAWTATLNGADVPQDRREGNRIRLDDLLADNELVVEATLPCVTSGDGMHRYVDPADGATYLTAFCGSDLAQRVFACFDQPDLKATVTLSVAAPEDWTVLGNGRATTTDDGVRHFATTPPISTYLFVVSAGPWHSVAWEHAGLPFAWHARRSLADALEREAAHLREVTEACFDHYTDLFDEPYPFDSYDQVFAPGLNWGALETPGCVTFRDEMLAPDGGSHTDNQLRAMVIAHEMAHMWFGDLVTLRWWEDIWLNESFADYMGFEVAQTAAGFEATWAWFTLSREHTGYAADERRSTHPVAQPPESVVDTDTGFANTDMITYSKGNAVLRQLVTWLGPDTFVAGVNRYLERAPVRQRRPRGLPRRARRRQRPRRPGLGRRLAADDRVRHARRTDRRRRRPCSTARAPDRTAPRSRRTTCATAGSSRPGRSTSTSRPTRCGWPPARPGRAAELLRRDVRPGAAGPRVVVRTARGRRHDRGPAGTGRGLDDRLRPRRACRARAVVTGGRRARAAPPRTLPSIWEAVVERLLEVTLPRHVEPADVPATREALTRLADRTTSPDLALPARRLMVSCTADVQRLSAMLEDDPDPDLSWRILVRLAELGRSTPTGSSASRPDAPLRRRAPAPPGPWPPCRRPRRRNAPGTCSPPTTWTTGSSTRSASGSGHRSRPSCRRRTSSATWTRPRSGPHAGGRGSAAPSAVSSRCTR